MMKNQSSKNSQAVDRGKRGAYESVGRGERGHISGDIAADVGGDGLAVDDLCHRRVAVVLHE